MQTAKMENKKITIASLRKLQRLEKAYEAAKAICISFGADEKSFSETDAKIEEIRAGILAALKGEVSNNVKSEQ